MNVMCYGCFINCFDVKRFYLLKIWENGFNINFVLNICLILLNGNVEIVIGFLMMDVCLYLW